MKVHTIEGEGHIEALNLGDLTEGQSWDDPMPVTMSRYEWHVVLAAITQQGHSNHAGLEALSREIRDNPPKNAMTALAMMEAVQGLVESDDSLKDASLKITEIIYPDFHAAYKNLVAAHDAMEAAAKAPYKSEPRPADWHEDLDR